jgi:hypothetical protein
MNNVTDNIQNKFARAFLKSYDKSNDIVAILQAGSSLNADISECLDVDLLAFTQDDRVDGTIYITDFDIRIETIMIPASKAVDIVKRSLRNQTISLSEMILNGKQVYGDESLVNSIRQEVSSLLLVAKSMYMPEAAGFAAVSLLGALARAKAQTDKMNMAFAILEFIGKTDGPSRGIWPMSPKYLGRLFAKKEGYGEGGLHFAIQSCVNGNSAHLLDYFSKWMDERLLPRPTAFRMIRPTGF